MSVQPQNQPRDGWVAEDEIDLRQYLDILIRWWREIVAITLGTVILAAIGVVVARLVLPPQYEASADVAIVRTISDVNFDERFRTNPEELTTNTVNLNARRTALLGLVATGTVAQEVIQQLGDQLSASEKNPAKLIEAVKAELATTGNTATDSDLIRITITANSPEKAAAIANAWAFIYVKTVNTVYGQVPNEVMESIQAELANAEERYLTSQANLETFVAENRVDALTNLVAVLQQRINQEVKLQEAFLTQWQQTQEQLSAAQALRVQIEQGGSGAARSNMAALQILKLSAYGMAPENLQIEVRDLPDVDQTAMVADIQSLIVSLEQRQQELTAMVDNTGLRLTEDESATTQVTIAMTETQSLSTTYQQLRNAKSQLEAETARQQQLIQQRDLTWETYKTLTNKVAELSLVRAAASSEVRFGAQAVPPVNPVKRIGLTIGIMIAMGIGLISAVILVSLLEYLGKVPLFGKAT